MDDLIASAVTHDLVRIKDENQALRLAFLATLVLSPEGQLPEALREYLTCHFSPLVKVFTNHRAPFTEDQVLTRARDADGNYRLILSDDFLRSLVPQ